ncbi:MAG: GNAT family N-acetyltransferase [Myxococcales bacterium]|nr:GNAT family N-acetyltransferase [Myxococcales bacterium]
MNLREASKSDLDTIVTLLADDDGAAERGYPKTPTDRITKAFEAISSDPNNYVFLAIQDHQTIGMFQLTLMPTLIFDGETRAQIESVRIRRDLRSNGLGKAMMRLAMAEATKRGATCIQLMSHRARVEAHGFYGALGFEDTHIGFKHRVAQRQTG